MKKIIAFIAISMMLAQSANAFSNNLEKLTYKVYDVLNILEANGRRIIRNDNLAADLLEILEETEKKVKRKLRRGGQSGHGMIDQTLVSITLDSCGGLNTWYDRKKCFSDALRNEPGALQAIFRGCSKISNDMNSSSCFDKSLKATQNTSVTLANVATSGCGSLNTWYDRKSCFKNFFNAAELSRNGYIIGQACGKISNDMNSSNCFSKALESTSFSNDDQVGRLLNSACGSLNTWYDRKSCYQNGVDAADATGLNLGRYTNQCRVSNDMNASNCFSKALSQL